MLAPTAPYAPPLRVPDESSARRGQLLLLVGIVLVALNLRPALASVGPLAAAIQASTGLSNAALGLLTTLPLLAFAVVSALTPLVTRRLGIEGAIALALTLLGLGTAARVLPSTAALFGGTLLFGVGIALGNVLLPALVKRAFPARSGAMTSVYSSAIGLGAAAAAGLSIPLATQLGWRGALGAWAALALVGLLVWVPQLVSQRRRRGQAAAANPVGVVDSLRDLGRSRLVWSVAAFMGLQSLAFYVVLAWLPSLLQARGLGAGAAGWMLALSQAAGIAGSALLPLWAARRGDQRRVIWLLAAVEAVALAGLLWPQGGYTAVWVALQGFALGGSFGLCLLLIVLRAANTATATALSGVAQSLGYLVAASGPALFGWLHDASGGWSVPLVGLVVVLLFKIVVGLSAARDRQVALRPAV